MNPLNLWLAHFYQLLWQVLSGFLLLSLLLFFLTVLAFLFILWYRWRDREQESLALVTLRARVPRDNEVKIDAMEQVFAALTSLRRGGRFKFLHHQPAVSFEIVGRPEKISFYIVCPRRFSELISRQIYAAYPGAELEEIEEYELFPKEGKVAYAWLETRGENYKPLRTFRELSVDSLAAITSALAKLKKNEAAAIQILVAPADSRWQKLGKAFISRTKKAEANPEKAAFRVSGQMLEAVEHKCSRPGFETTIRLLAVAATKEEAKSHLANLRSAFSQFASPWNGFKSHKVRFKHWFMIDFIYRYQPIWWGWHNRKTILNSEELASLFHLPNKMVTTPGIDWLGAKRAPAPSNIPQEGLYLGRNVYRGVVRPIYLKHNDRRRHIYIVGKTGTGKSELLKDLILQDIYAGRGICLVDPHDLAEQILEFIPPERAEDVIYFDPANLRRPMGLNLLDVKTEDQKHFVTAAVINLMYKLFDPYKTGIVGPRFEHAIRNAMLTVMSEPGATFVEVVRVLTDPNFVRELLPKVTDPMVRRYWTDQIAHTSDFHKSEVLDYIVSKFGRFVTNKMMRNIIGQSTSSFDFRQVMDEGKILIINLAKGKIGEENSSFLGLILIPRILMAAMSRQDIPEEKRRDFYLYVDEFQNFATPDFAQILSEARKYRLNLTVANQFISQMEDEVKNAVFGNVGTVISFRVGVSDASYLAREFQPVFGEQDLLNIERFHVYIKTIVDNEPVPPFSMDLTKDMAAQDKLRRPQVAAMVKRLSALKYGRPRAEVEAEIARRAKL